MSDPPDSDLDWTEQGPRSRRFDDVYFSAEDGLAESRLVFLEGCGLPDAWRGRARFVVGELGFGTGLNALALIDLWRRERKPGARLHLFSVEGFPITRAEATQALAAWPELADIAAELLAQWPDGHRGFHRIELPGWGVLIDLAVMEARVALEAWTGRADAWFLDGFAPSRNPEMWTSEVLALVAARSAPGARAATYTVAGAVRRGLEAAGFTLERRPGHGRKRERLQARLPSAAAPSVRPTNVAVIGGGIAGVSLVRALRALGVEPTLVEADRLGAGSSGNPAALVTPRLDAGLGASARLHAQAFSRTSGLYRRETPEAVIAQGVLQLQRRPRDAARFAAVSTWEAFAPGALELRTGESAIEALGEPAPDALYMRDALVIEPSPVLKTWTEAVNLQSGRVERLERLPAGWRLLGEDEETILEADLIILACGLASTALAGLPPLRPVRGQVSWAEHNALLAPSAWGGYAIPTREAVLFGATHDRGDLDTDARPEDDARNLATLAEMLPVLAAALAGRPLGSRAATRAATPDHLPLAGAVPGEEGLFVLAGLGGRGFTLAPLLAEHVAALALGAPSPLPSDLAPLVDPARFSADRGDTA